MNSPAAFFRRHKWAAFLAHQALLFVAALAYTRRFETAARPTL